MSNSKWPLLAAVCAAHVVLISLFSATGSSGSARQEIQTFQVRLREPPQLENAPVDVDVSTRQSEIPHEGFKPKRPVPSLAPNQLGDPQTATSSVLSMKALSNKARFLDVDEVDAPALATTQFEGALDQALPSRFELIVLELLIDEAGRTVSALCIGGDCGEALAQRLQLLLVVPFAPAQKDGIAVASRKIIQISPLPDLRL